MVAALGFCSLGPLWTSSLGSLAPQAEDSLGSLKQSWGRRARPWRPAEDPRVPSSMYGNSRAFLIFVEIAVH